MVYLPLHVQVSLLDETTNILTVSLRGLKSNIKYAEDYVKLAVAQSANTFPTTKVSCFVGGTQQVNESLLYTVIILAYCFFY